MNTLVTTDTLDTLNTLDKLDILDTLHTLDILDTLNTLHTLNILDTLHTKKLKHFEHIEDWNVFQILILDRKIVTITNKKFELLGFSLRIELKNCNSHALISLVTNEEVIALEESAFQKLKRDYEELVK